MFSNEKHPELQEGEVWLTNMDPQDDTWDHIGYATKRMGRIAYSTEGQLIPGMVPVFAKKEELESFRQKLSF